MSGRGLAVEGQAVAFGANLLYFLNVPQIWFYKVWSGLQKRCEGFPLPTPVLMLWEQGTMGDCSVVVQCILR